DEEYEDTRQLMEDIRFDSAFIFKYSERKGTYAKRKLADDIASAVKTERIVELIDLQKRATNEINQVLIGTVQEVLIEEPTEKDPGLLIGRTDNFKNTIVPAEGIGPGDIVDVTIVDARGATLYGRLVPNAAYAT
ncbi:MAG: TRAM domain-containing protein, partial [Candidatus Krumholzibacteria bacterium]|nr:TRAM domain-containing protein [Candidatus Krumholzibacteria bacterium]